LITTSQYDNQLDHNNLISEINKQEDNLRVLKASKVELEGRKTLLENQIDESERLKVILEKNLDQTKLNLKNLQRDIDNIRNDEKITNLKNQIDAQKKSINSLQEQDLLLQKQIDEEMEKIESLTSNDEDVNKDYINITDLEQEHIKLKLLVDEKDFQISELLFTTQNDDIEQLIEENEKTRDSIRLYEKDVEILNNVISCMLEGKPTTSQKKNIEVTDDDILRHESSTDEVSFKNITKTIIEENRMPELPEETPVYPDNSIQSILENDPLSENDDIVPITNQKVTLPINNTGIIESSSDLLMPEQMDGKNYSLIEQLSMAEDIVKRQSSLIEGLNRDLGFAKDDENIPLNREGYLIKQGNFIKSWKRRFFFIESDHMYYSISKQEKFKTKGAIPLKGARCGECIIPGLEFTFQIQTVPDRTFFLIASTQNEMIDWIQTINQTITSVE